VPQSLCLGSQLNDLKRASQGVRLLWAWSVDTGKLLNEIFVEMRVVVPGINNGNVFQGVVGWNDETIIDSLSVRERRLFG
jgi:hypothetical protein